ncbi:MAG: MFS transporter [Verrucomicrobiota bacterium]
MSASQPAAADSPRDWRSMIGVLIVQSHNVLNDKIAQFVLIGLAGVVAVNIPKESWTFNFLDNYDICMSIAMALPFVLLAPLAGFASDRLSKRSVIMGCLVLQVLVIALIVGGLWMQTFWLTTLGFFLLAVQSAMLSPAKMGICKELVGSQKLAVAAGWMSMLTILCIILGTVVAGAAFAALKKRLGDEWDAGLYLVGGLLLLSFIPFLVMAFVRKTPAQSTEPFRPSLLVRHFVHLAELMRQRELRLAGFGTMFFWFAGGAIALILIDAGKEIMAVGEEEDAIKFAGYFNGALGVGIAAGSLMVSAICRKGNELGLIPVGAVGMAITMSVMFFLTPNTWAYYLTLTLIGTTAAAYYVPLNALIQDSADPDKRGRVLSAVNLLNSLAGLVAIGFVFLMRGTDLSTRFQFLILAVLAVAAAAWVLQLMPRHFLRFITLGLAGLIYKVKAIHPDRVPKDSGVLMISNHVSYIDAFIISLASPRPVRFVIMSDMMSVKPVAWFLRMFHVIPISSTRAKDAIKITAEAVYNGDVVCIFPEGRLTRTGMLNDLRRGFELIARKSESPVMPVYMDALWGSIFSFERLKYFYKAPLRFPYPVTVNFGELIPHDQVNAGLARAAIQDLSAEAFDAREDLDRPLAGELVKALKRKPGAPAWIELGRRRRVMKRSVVLANTVSLARVWRENWNEDRQRIGILLPPGSMPALFNIAAVLAGRTPVNLPLELATLDEVERQQLLNENRIDCVMTSVHLFQGGELPANHFDMTAEVLQIGAFARIRERIAARFEWSRITTRRLGAPSNADAFAYLTRSDEDEDYQLVTLSQRNLLASVYQIDSTLLFQPRDEIFLESSFDRLHAALLGLWHPVLKRGAAIYRGLSARQTPVSITLEEEEPQLVLLSPAMTEEILAGGQAPPESVRGLLDFSAGGLSDELMDRLEENGADYCRWADSDELGAMFTMSTTDPNSMIPEHTEQTSKKRGSIGRLMPGVSGKIVDAQGEIASLHEEGRLFVKSAAFSADAPWSEIDGERWIDTGLPGHFDEDGFFIVGKPK